MIRIKNLDFTGSFVYHCHILEHEDRGMMSLNTVQPETPIYVTGAGQGGGPAVNVYSGIDNSVLASFFAFDSSFTGGVQTAVADVNNDGISDVIVGAGPGGGPRVIVYNGATNFTTTLLTSSHSAHPSLAGWMLQVAISTRMVLRTSLLALALVVALKLISLMAELEMFLLSSMPMISPSVAASLSR